MKTNRSDYFIAAAVIACSVVLLVALTVALSGWKPNRKARVIYVDFPDVTGIRLHSPVRYAGAPAGSVSAFRLLTDEERNNTNWSAVRVTLTISDDVPELPDDVRASLASDTLLSEKFIALSAGSPNRPKLPEGSILLGASAAGLETVMDSVGPLMQSVDRLVAQLQGTVAGFDKVLEKTGAAVDTLDTGMKDALPRISDVADSFKTTAETATNALARIDKVVGDIDPKLKEDLNRLGAALTDLQKVLVSVNNQVDGRMAELSVVLQNLKVVSTHAKTLSKTLAEKPHRLIFGGSGKPPELPSEQEIIRSNRPVPVR